MRTLTSSSNLFFLDLRYNTPDSGIPQFNGNTSQMQYLTTKVSQPGYKTFAYTYDKFNRLTVAASTAGALDEQISYDQIGNIIQLVRGGAGGGTLTYPVYEGNQLKTVTGYSPRNYVYDANGNAGSDGMGKNITYNMLNLPQSVTSGPATVATYTYDAGGNKLKNTGTDGSWDYVNGIVYKNNAIDFVSTEEGRVKLTGGAWNYEYHLKDHLGNTRVSIDRYNNAPRVIQEDEYYSFVLRKPTGGYDYSNNNRYLYNGKELHTDLANQYDYGARFYDPVVGRFNVIDRFAEKYDGLSPYHYGVNNPILNVDINGDSLWVVHKGNQILYENGKVYNKDGSAYTGPGVKTNKDGTTKLTGFLKQAVNGLNSIRTGGEAGNELIGNLQSSKENVFVRDGSSNNTRGLMVTWNPSSTEGGIDANGNRSTSSFIGLAHELAHAWDWAADGQVDTRTWFTMSDGKTIPNAEQYGSHWENRIRGENGLPLRAFYGIDNGAGVGRVLIPSTRMSPNYIQQLGPIIIPYYYREVQKPKK